MFSLMSRAFVKEDVDPPERSGRKRSASGLPPGATNYITAHGAKRLREELNKLRAANAEQRAHHRTRADSGIGPRCRSSERAVEQRYVRRNGDGHG